MKYSLAALILVAILVLLGLDITPGIKAPVFTVLAFAFLVLVSSLIPQARRRA
jgi:hypothetical protein